jgi:hypothetical protein
MSLLETLPEEYLNGDGAGGVKPPPVFVFPSYFFISPKDFNGAAYFLIISHTFSEGVKPARL